MPVVGLCDWVPRPVRCFEIFENDSRVLVFFRRLAPDIEVFVSEIIVVAGGADPRRGCARCWAAAGSARGPNSVARDSATRFLKPRVLIRCVVDNQFGNDAQIALMRGVQKRSEILERAENRIDVEVIGNVVAVVSQWGWIERQQPDRG